MWWPTIKKEFPTDDACLEYIKEQRWPDGIAPCAKCKGERKHYRVTGRTAYACERCGNHIYPLAGTIFEKSTTRLKLWFHAMHQMESTNCVISAKQIQRETGVAYNTARRMSKLIRSLMAEGIGLEVLSQPLPDVPWRTHPASGRPQKDVYSTAPDATCPNARQNTAPTPHSPIWFPT
jgi:hypothetical protein